MVANALLALPLFALTLSAEPPGDEARISPAGQRLREVLDRADVAHHWLAGVHVDWKSGEPDGKVERHPEHATHCSAFVASLADRLNVPLLRPPEHPDHELANAQFDWLLGQAGRSSGWVPVASPLEAQQRANRGEWVLAVYRATKEGHHGHVAVVPPPRRPPPSSMPMVRRSPRRGRTTTRAPRWRPASISTHGRGEPSVRFDSLHMGWRYPSQRQACQRRTDHGQASSASSMAQTHAAR